jgi:PhnB protein
MSTPIKPIPDGYHAVTPYLIVRGAAQALEFYQRAFGASVVLRLDGPGGKVMHAEVKIGDSHVMLADECPEMGAQASQAFGGSPVMLHLYVPDVDTIFAQAVAAGALVKRPVQDQFYGDRSGMVTDPFGLAWNISTHTEDVTPEEINRRAAAMFSGTAGKEQ